MNKEFLKIVAEDMKKTSPRVKTASKQASPKVKTVSKQPSPKVKTVSKQASPKVKTVSKQASSGMTTSKSPTSKTRSKLFEPYKKQWIPTATDEGMKLRKLIKHCEKCPKKGEFYDSSLKACVSRSSLRSKDLEISDFCEVYKREIINRSEQDIKIINNILESQIEVEKGRFVPLKDIGNLDKIQLDQRIKQGNTSYAVLKIANAVGRMMKDNPRLGDKMRNAILDNIKNVDKGFAALFFTIFKKNIRGNIINLFSYLSFGEITAILGAIFGAFWKMATFLLAKFPKMNSWGKKMEKIVKNQANTVKEYIAPSEFSLVVPNAKNEIINLLIRHNQLPDGAIIKGEYIITNSVTALGIDDRLNHFLDKKLKITGYSRPKIGIFKDLIVYEIESGNSKIQLLLGGDRFKLFERLKEALKSSIEGSENIDNAYKKYKQYLDLNKLLEKLQEEHENTKVSNIKNTLEQKIKRTRVSISELNKKWGSLFDLFKYEKGIAFVTDTPKISEPLKVINDNITSNNVNLYLNELLNIDMSILKIYTYINHVYNKINNSNRHKRIHLPLILEDTYEEQIPKLITDISDNSSTLERRISGNSSNQYAIKVKMPLLVSTQSDNLNGTAKQGTNLKAVKRSEIEGMVTNPSSEKEKENSPKIGGIPSTSRKTFLSVNEIKEKIDEIRVREARRRIASLPTNYYSDNTVNQETISINKSTSPPRPGVKRIEVLSSESFS